MAATLRSRHADRTPSAAARIMICILHGYLLEGSGSNLWTRAIIEALCREGAVVHLMAQENHPERYPFISEARRYTRDGAVEVWHQASSPYRGRCILHKPVLGDTLPVYVRDRYEEFPRAIPMVELSDAELEDYIEVNVRALEQIVRENGITALHANHSVMQSVVAQRVSQRTGVPYAIMPHGSALEYAVKRDERLHRMAEQAFLGASHVFVHGEEMSNRVLDAMPALNAIVDRFSHLHLGVDITQFEPIAREQRPANIEALGQSLAGMPRGRTAAQTEMLLDGLGSARTDAALLAVFDAARDFDSKAPDADVEAKLAQVDWSSDATLLFVGRLISTKGVHGVIAAMPFLLERRPDLRLLVVGHGPLREPLEVMLHALRTGNDELFDAIVARGRVLEGSPEGESGGTELTQVARYYEQLRACGEMERYRAAARMYLRPDSVIFTGYLTHRELRFLFPCCDAAVFPSVVREAGPLVFLEALASGAFPLGTYFGGQRESIDSIADALPATAIEAMKLRPEAEHTVTDIVANVPTALQLGAESRAALHRIARERYDWASVARMLASTLEIM